MEIKSEEKRKADFGRSLGCARVFPVIIAVLLFGLVILAAAGLMFFQGVPQWLGAGAPAASPVTVPTITFAGDGSGLIPLLLGLILVGIIGLFVLLLLLGMFLAVLIPALINLGNLFKPLSLPPLPPLPALPNVPTVDINKLVETLLAFPSPPGVPGGVPLPTPASPEQAWENAWGLIKQGKSMLETAKSEYDARATALGKWIKQARANGVNVSSEITDMHQHAQAGADALQAGVDQFNTAGGEVISHIPSGPHF
jgi:hypothetical protein